ncbi:MAG: response regulator [Chitinophagaceae bacterium]|nr:response regulator [Chitinophagaceae bacterium]
MEKANTRKPRIIIADDEADVLMLMEVILSREGFDVEVSPNAENLMDKVTRQPPDIILLDVRMQGVDGEAICKQLKTDRKTKKIPIILFSANSDLEQIASNCGADDILRKPFRADVAREKFNRILAKSSFGLIRRFHS